MQKLSLLIFTVVLSSFGLSGCLTFSLLNSDRTVARKKNQPKSKSGNARKAENNSAPKILNVEKNTNNVNVMGTVMPEMPDFDELSPKPGKVCGYVKDVDGNPLQGAQIGVRSTMIGGAYSGAQGETDADGYYEFSIPTGVAHFYNAGYQIEWGDGVAAIGLHPVDGKLDSFASANGAVENFVMLPYGITSRENLQENPHLASTYYGGSIYISYSATEVDDNNPMPGSVLENSIIEVTLTPEGEMFEGVEPRSFVVRKTAGFQTGFKINNLPLGRYRISVKSNNQSLKMKLNKPQNSPFGMTPAETSDSAIITFDPSEAKANMVAPNFGSWNSVEINVARR